MNKSQRVASLLKTELDTTLFRCYSQSQQLRGVAFLFLLKLKSFSGHQYFVFKNNKSQSHFPQTPSPASLRRHAPAARPGGVAQKKEFPERPPGLRGTHINKKRRLPTLPHCCAVPSAQPGLTSLFGMGRGGAPALSPPECSFDAKDRRAAGGVMTSRTQDMPQKEEPRRPQPAAGRHTHTA